MNKAESQDTKLAHRNPLHSYRLTMRKQRNLGNNPIHHCDEKNKILRNKCSKETKDLYIENYKTLMKEIKEDTNRWRNIPCS